MLKYLLDTNTVIYTINNKPEHVRNMFEQHDGQMAISAVTMMELVYGAEKSHATERNLRVIESFAARLETLAYDAHASSHTGQIRADLARRGTPIGPYDQMIAGHARALGLILVTNNEKEFLRVPGLRLENWVK